MLLIAKELASFLEADERILGLVVLDLPDTDYARC
jgi:hypothetical protein